jgi:multidrug efflux pump subunit AcrB
MTAIVRIALERPYTFIVMALLMLIGGVLAIIRMPTDIFPNIGVPAIGVAFTYTGLPPEEVANRMLTNYERLLPTTVNDIEHTESMSLPGMGIVKVFFQPNVDIRQAMSQITAVSQTAIRPMPPGTQPPLIINYNASTVPIIQLATSSKVLSEQQTLDNTSTVMRPVLAVIPGAAIPNPYGGKGRNILIDIDPQALQAKGLSAQDVANAVSAQNQINPVGNAKIGSLFYNVKLNNSAATIAELNDLPIKTVNGATIFIHDVGQVRDGSPPQGNVVHVDGARAVLTTIMKNGSASTLDVIQGVKDAIPRLRELLPDELDINVLNDQSVFVSAAVSGVVHEGIIAAALTSLMILLFLGSWRSTLIIAISIPLAVLSALAGLWAMGETLNIMTLGGLALAVGILVDDATVTIENVNWHLEQGKPVRDAIMDGARQIVTPALVSLLCSCIVFVPMFALPGVSGYLFIPMAEAVVFAMIASFILSRTLVPTMAMYMLQPHVAPGERGEGADHHLHQALGNNAFARFQRRFESWFEEAREGYRNLLAFAMHRRRGFVIGFGAVVIASLVLVPFLGSNFFPSVDSGQIAIHVRAPIGTRIENTSVIFGDIAAEIRKIIPPRELSTIVDNIGMPNSAVNMIYNNSGQIGSQDGDIFISLNSGHAPVDDYVRTLRERLPRAFPGVNFAFLPADIVSQILNFGSPAPIQVQVAGSNANYDKNEAYAINLLRQIRQVRGIADARIMQSSLNPQLRVDVDRSRISQLGMNERDVTVSLGTSLAGTSQSSPGFFLDPRTGVSYGIVTQMPEYRITSLSSLENIPLTGAGSNTGGLQILGGVSRISRAQSPAVVTHYNIQPTFDIYASTQDRDLGGVARDVQRIIDANLKDKPRGTTATLRGQAVTMSTAFTGLFWGILAAIVLIYLLIVVNFQSWLDPFVIITALPAALVGIIWMLFVTGTTLSVPALTGAIMCMGVATANSILVVSFARERLAVTGDAVLAAVEAGFVRFRPVIMTALAMIIGMAPMALGLGQGGEQNAPLGRAVIGGLIFATCATLMFVPVVFSIVHGRKSHTPASSFAPAFGESRA